MGKVVYKDDNITKVAKGTVTFEADFVVVTDPNLGTIRINNKNVVTVKQGGI